MGVSFYQAHNGVWVGTGSGIPVAPAPPTPPVVAPPPVTTPGSPTPVAPSGKPGGSNTGVPKGTPTLIKYEGDITVTKPNQVFDGLDISGYIKNYATGTIIRNCAVRGSHKIVQSSSSDRPDTALIDSNSASSKALQVINCLLVPTFPSVWVDGIIGHDYTARGCNVYATVDGFGVYNKYATAANVILEGNWVHDLSLLFPDPEQSDVVNGKAQGHTHNDGVQVQGGSNVRIVGNNFQDLVGPTSNLTTAYNPAATGQGILLQGNNSKVTDVVASGNWIDGGAYGVTIVPTAHGIGVVTLSGNRFGRLSHFAAIRIDPSVTTVTTSGNVYDDNGSAATIVRA